MKRILPLWIAVIILLITVTPPVYAGGALPSYTSRTDFDWGINSHPANYDSYPAKYLEQQISLIARAGCTMIRIGGIFENDMELQDQMVGLCNQYGLKIIMVYSPSRSEGLEYIKFACKSLAERYDGKEGRGYVDCFQIWNETDIALGRAKYGVGGSREGRIPDDYYTIPVEGYDDLPEFTEYFKAAADGIHEAGTGAKFMINFSYRHWGTIIWYLEHGVKIDMIGWDFYPYSQQERDWSDLCKQDVDNFEADVYEKYKVPVIICETNTNVKELVKSREDSHVIANYDNLFTVIDEIYTRDWVNGLIVYELLDEPSRENEVGEAQYGLVDCERGGEIGSQKPIYRELQRMWGGNDNLPVLDRNEVDLKPYSKFIVDTADETELVVDTTDETVSTVDTADETESTVNTPAKTESNAQITDETESTVNTPAKTESNTQTTDKTESTVDIADETESIVDTDETGTGIAAGIPNIENEKIPSPDIADIISDEEDSVITDFQDAEQLSDVKTIVKQINVTQKSYRLPWVLVILVSAGILAVTCGAVWLFLYLKIKKSHKHQL